MPLAISAASLLYGLPTNYLHGLQVDYLGAGVEAQAALSSMRVAEAEASLESGRAAWEAEKIKEIKASKAHNAATTIISHKDGELNAALAALAVAQAQALADVVATRTTVEAEMAAVPDEGKEVS